MITCRPLFKKVPGQDSAYPSYLEITADGEVNTICVTWDGTPADVWNGSRLWFPISSHLTSYEIKKFLKVLAPKIKSLLDISHIESFNGKQKRVEKSEELEVKYTNILSDIAYCCCDIITDDFEHCGDEDCEYCAGLC